ncbi:MAG: branched-chain amino acid aminotransferase [Bacilli bacterium]|nr:branched-chain amino acid aminotransferase [Bacilli bacterium]
MNIKVTLSSNKKTKPSKGINLGFGKIFTDHMFTMKYTDGIGWHDPEIKPYQTINLDPACMVFHYAQEVFEGLKAYRGEGNKTMLFRPEANAKRMYDSCKRLCIPPVEIEDFCQAVEELVKVDADWIPEEDGSSLYIRPFIIATDEFLGVHPSKTYLFVIILSPSGSYYKNGLEPVNIWIEDSYVRAIRGGIGFAKTGGNYAASLIGQQKAEKEGYAQVLWLDGIEHKYIEEVGAMNIFFKINGTLITPELNGSILPGITRDTIIKLARCLGYRVEERRISVEEIIGACKRGELEEIFGTGTAAVISPVGKIRYKEENFIINNHEIGEVSQKLFDLISDIQHGRVKDEWGFTKSI